MAVLPQVPVTDFEKAGFTPVMSGFFVRLANIFGLLAQGTGFVLTANRAVISDSSGGLAASDTTSTEVGFLDGVSGPIQSQLNNKLFVSTTGGEVAWEDMLISAGALRTVGAGVPSFSAMNATESYGLEFTDEAVAGNEKRVSVSTQFSHGYKQGTDIYVHVHFFNDTSPGANQVVRFQLDYTWTNVTGVLPANTTIYVDKTIPSGTTAFTHLTASFPAITGTGKKESSVFAGVLRRNSSHANDTYTGGIAFVVSVDAHYQKEKAGTLTEFPT